MPSPSAPPFTEITVSRDEQRRAVIVFMKVVKSDGVASLRGYIDGFTARELSSELLDKSRSPGQTETAAAQPATRPDLPSSFAVRMWFNTRTEKVHVRDPAAPSGWRVDDDLTACYRAGLQQGRDECGDEVREKGYRE